MVTNLEPEGRQVNLLLLLLGGHIGVLISARLYDAKLEIRRRIGSINLSR